MPKSSNRKNDTRRANRDRRERLEELRRQQRASERRKNILFAGSAIAVAIVLIAAAIVPAWLHDRAQKAKLKAGYQASPTAAEKAAGCLGVHNDPISGAALHVTDPIDYSKEKYGDTNGGTPAIPPSNGRHNPISLSDKNRFFPVADKPRPERAVHDLEHGYVIAWYDDKLPAKDVSTLQNLATTLPRFMVVGWWQSELPAGKHVVLTSWGRTDRCASASPGVVRDFYSKHVDSPLAPEKGQPPTSGSDQIAPDVLPSAPASPMPSASASASATTKSKKK